MAKVDGIQFRRPCGHALIHASKDGKKTLCGIGITIIWAAADEAAFKRERSCKDCKAILRKTLRKGRQISLAELTKF